MVRRASPTSLPNNLGPLSTHPYSGPAVGSGRKRWGEREGGRKEVKDREKEVKGRERSEEGGSGNLGESLADRGPSPFGVKG